MRPISIALGLLPLLLVSLLGAPVCVAEPGASFEWPLRPRPAVVRAFDKPARNWLPGHRGVDLAGSAGDPVLAAGDGVVVFAGTVAGKPVVSVDHAGGLRTTYEPVTTPVALGRRVFRGESIGVLTSGHAGCPVEACLHWGLRRGDDYLDPLGLLRARPIRLKPLAAILPSGTALSAMPSTATAPGPATAGVTATALGATTAVDTADTHGTTAAVGTTRTGDTAPTPGTAPTRDAGPAVGTAETVGIAATLGAARQGVGETWFTGAGPVQTLSASSGWGNDAGVGDDAVQLSGGRRHGG